MLADLAVMANVHEIIELYARSNACVGQGSAIDGRVRAYFYVITNFDDTDLGKFPMAAFPKGVTKSIGA